VLRTVWHAAPQGAALAESCLAEAVFHPAINERAPHPHPAPVEGKLAARVRERIVGLGQRQGSRWQRIAGTEDLRLAAAPASPCGSPPAPPTAPARRSRDTPGSW
jgi:hypothetical protein